MADNDKTNSALATLDMAVGDMTALTEGRLATAELELSRLTAALWARAEYHLLRAYYHASPSLVVFLAAIWAGIKIIWKVIQTILDIISLYKALGIHDMLYNSWAAYRNAIDNLFGWISKVSQQLGWGVDGLIHLMNLAQLGYKGFGAMMGKGDEWGEITAIGRVDVVLTKLKVNLDKAANDPGAWIESIANHESKLLSAQTGGWAINLFKTIKDGTDIANKAVFAVSQVIDNLQELENALPGFVRKYIPQAIWDGIDKADSLISNKLIPGLSDVNKRLNYGLRAIDGHTAKIRSLSSALAKPGDLLARIDALDEVARKQQEALIDDVASRELKRRTDADIANAAAELAALDRLIAAGIPPGPQPGFMDIATPARRQATGIVPEPAETWMVGGFNSPY